MKFAIAGIGYIAIKHLNAIKSIGGDLLYAHDIRDSVGILDSYFPKAKFFIDIDKFKKVINEVDYLVICTPNYTHIGYIELAGDTKVICEKPLVLTTSEYERIKDVDVNVILQLRYNKIPKCEDKKIVIDYCTPRGDWYFSSWKNFKFKSGGLITNIGIHLFDLMVYNFGKYSNSKLFYSSDKIAEGFFNAGEKEIFWKLSIHEKYGMKRTINGYPLDIKEINGKDLHTLSYEEIINGKGFKKEDVLESIKLVEEYRRMIPSARE